MLLDMAKEPPLVLPISPINQVSCKEGNGYFVNPLLSHLLNEHIDCFMGHEGLLLHILWDATKTNKKVIDELHKHELIDLSLLTNGVLKDGGDIIGSLYTCNIDKPIDFSSDAKHTIEELNQQINEVKFNQKVLTGGYSKKEQKLKDGKLYKKASHNQIEYEFLNKMREIGFKQVPVYYGQEDGFDVFSYIEGNTRLFVSDSPMEEIRQVVETLRKIHDLTRNPQDGTVIVHGDLSPMNTVFKDGLLQGVIDWDGCAYGQDYEDFVYVFWTWANVGDPLRNDEHLFEVLLKMLRWYGASDSFKEGFYQKLMETMENRLKDKEPLDEDYERIRGWVRYSETWVVLYRERIKREIG